ncbi:MAG: peptidoglycan editing factor PgeF [Firmicutes bacterium]|jgi:YfiH family protein|nr:peptidoglycan editing factor PgeF [Bacillota bacterium]
MRERERIIAANGISYLVFANLEQAKVLHGFSLRHGGVSSPPYDSLNMGLHVGDEEAKVLENRRRFAQALGYRVEKVVTGRQVHGISIARVTGKEAGRGHASYAAALPDTDGLITTAADVVLMAHAADCTLLFFYDPHIPCIGLAHAGWRGAVAGMGPAMVGAMCEAGSRPERILVALAPTIGPCCLQVGEDVADAVPADLCPQVVHRTGDGFYLDLPEFHALQLVAAGIRRDNLVKSSYCTKCRQDLFYSYRGAGGRTGRMAGIIMLKWQA